MTKHNKPADTNVDVTQDENNITQTKTVEEERDEYLAGWKRALADYENLKKDLMKEREYIRTAMTEAIASAYLPIYDHLMAATCNTPDIPEAKKWFEGVGHIAQQCKDTLAEFGVMTIDTKEKKFDPSTHEAVGAAHDATKEEDMILREMQTGFTLNNKVIRPSKVIVNKKNEE